MGIKMIAMDLDGTLLRTDKTISERTKNVLKICREARIKVVYATGRGSSAGKVAATEIFDAGITMNGAVAKVDNNIVYCRLIPWQVARPILMVCNEKGMRITSEITGMHYSNFAVSDEWPHITNFEIVDFARHNVDAEKLYSPNLTPENKSFIERHLPNELYLVITDDRGKPFGSILHKEATKAKAVAELARLWGVEQNEIATFGDDLNDIDMLEYAGVGVAMGNALNEVKAVADAVCLSNDEDGIAKWLENNILGEF